MEDVWSDVAECPICFARPPTHHHTNCVQQFCSSCLNEILQTQIPLCPLCRKPFTSDDLIPVIREREKTSWSDDEQEQKKEKVLGGTMRLGSYPCKLLKGSKVAEAYGENMIFERHRHRYEFNN